MRLGRCSARIAPPSRLPTTCSRRQSRRAQKTTSPLWSSAARSNERASNGRVTCVSESLLQQRRNLIECAEIERRQMHVQDAAAGAVQRREISERLRHLQYSK